MSFVSFWSGLDSMTEIFVSAYVHLTENYDKVFTAISNIFGDCDYITEERDGRHRITGTSKDIQSLGPFRDIISRMRIRDAARSFLERIAQKDYLSFGLHKQAAYAGAVSFHQAGDSPLDPIQVKITGDILEITDFLCGKPPIPLF